MKILYTFFLIVILSYSCTKENQDDSSINLILGKWQLVTVYSNIGNGEGIWNPVEQGYSLTVYSDNRFATTRFDSCLEGTYSINEVDNTITFNYDCIDFNPCDGSNSCKEYYSLDKSSLTLSATYLQCDEGCPIYKFEKSN